MQPVPSVRIWHGRWSSASVYEVLKKETYTGIWRYGKTSRKTGKYVKLSEPSDISTQVPALIERHVWESVQKRLEENRRTARRNAKNNYLIGRRVKCASCGGRMHGRSCPKNGKSYTYYTCNARRFPEKYDYTCNAPHFRHRQVDAAVWQWMQSVLIDPDALALGLTAQRAEAERLSKPLRQQATRLEGQIGSLRVQEERLLDIYLDGEIDKAQWLKRRGQIRSKLTTLTGQLEDIEERLQENQVTDEQIRSVQQFAHEISLGIEAIENDFEAKRHIVDMLDVQVSLGFDDEGDEVAYASCSFQYPELCIVSETTHVVDTMHNPSY